MVNEFTESPEAVMRHRQTVEFWQERIPANVEVDATYLLDRVSYEDDLVLQSQFRDLNNQMAEIRLRMGIIAAELGMRSMQ